MSDKRLRRWPRVGSFRYTVADDRWEWSDEVAQMHGYAPGTVTPTTELVLSHKHPDDKPTVAELIEQVRQHGAAFSSRHRIIDTNGDVHVMVVVGDQFYEGDRVAGTAGFYVDVTAQFNDDVQDCLTDAIVAISERRAVINQAIGLLMVRHGVSAQAAFDILTARSQARNVKLRTIAERLMTAAGRPGMLSDESAARLDELLASAEGADTEAGAVEGAAQ